MMDIEREQENEQLSQPVAEEAGFSSAFDPNHETVKNRHIRAIVENCNIYVSQDISAYIGRTFDMHFNALQFVNPFNVLEKNTEYFLGDFIIDNHPEHGLLLFEYAFLDKIINFLYGAGEDADKSCMQFGKCAFKIAYTIADIIIKAFEKATEEVQAHRFSLLSVNNNLNSIRKRDISHSSCQLRFSLVGMQMNAELCIILPESYIQELIFEKNDMSFGEKTHTEKMQSHFHEEIIDSTVDIIAVLPGIKMKLSDIMNLKKGDMIPIKNPEMVDIKLGQNKGYRAMVGQSNKRRMVKIIEKI